MLLEESRELEASLRKQVGIQMKEGTAFFASSVRDQGDCGLFEFEQEIQRRRMINGNEKWKKIQSALDRVTQATYGICEECGAEISERRLRALPFAANCLECQESLENRKLTENFAPPAGSEDPLFG
jgi:DnaK suppressor protein